MASGWRAGCARGVEVHVIHPARVAVSREHWRAKTDRLDTELLTRLPRPVARRESGCSAAYDGASGLDPSSGTHLRTLLRAALIARGRRQLQYGRALTGDQPRDHHDLSIREFEGVVMQVPVAHVDLPESGNLMIHARSAEQAESALVLDVFVKSQFRARKYRQRRRVRQRRRSRR
jgi:hypothetical protein